MLIGSGKFLILGYFFILLSSSITEYYVLKQGLCTNNYDSISFLESFKFLPDTLMGFYSVKKTFLK